jgi:hypothetical protein
VVALPKRRSGGISTDDKPKQSTESMGLFGCCLAVVFVVGDILIADAFEPFADKMEDNFHLVIPSRAKVA